jgi:starch synthase
MMSHPTGNQNVRNALLAFAEHDMLAEFWTAIAWNPESKWNGLMPLPIRRQLERRTFAEAPRERVRCSPWREMVRLGVRSTLLEGVLSSGERPYSVIGVYRDFDARVARRLREYRADAVYAYEGGALQTFREAKRQGIPAIYDLASGHWYWERELLRDEERRNPKLVSVIPNVWSSSGPYSARATPAIASALEGPVCRRSPPEKGPQLSPRGRRDARQ